MLLSQLLRQRAPRERHARRHVLREPPRLLAPHVVGRPVVHVVLPGPEVHGHPVVAPSAHLLPGLQLQKGRPRSHGAGDAALLPGRLAPARRAPPRRDGESHRPEALRPIKETLHGQDLRMVYQVVDVLPSPICRGPAPGASCVSREHEGPAREGKVAHVDLLVRRARQSRQWTPGHGAAAARLRPLLASLASIGARVLAGLARPLPLGSRHGLHAAIAGLYLSLRPHAGGKGELRKGVEVHCLWLEGKTLP
mmetsp:Transcript_72468/g.212366  ORF Transcript_72468/g.212366 Transcript_72468/m.212366 type:complete len:252 (+) Transcript_72468:670-1425(+)